MTKKDFNLIAMVLKNSYYLEPNQRYTLAKDFADSLSFSNPKFDYNRFVQACIKEN